MSSNLVQELYKLLEFKERLLMISLREGSMLKRDDPEFLRCLEIAEVACADCKDQDKRKLAKQVVGHIRQFNPFNTSDVDENEFLSQVIEDFLNFSRIRIEKLTEK